MRKNKFILLIFSIVCIYNTSCFRNTNTNTSLNQISYGDKVFNLKTVDDLYQFLSYNENRYPLISAHRGGGFDEYPENAIESFDYLSKRGPFIIECDIRLSKDSIPILMHDMDLERTTTGKGSIDNYSLEELKKLRLKDNKGQETNFQIPTLEEALIWGKNKVIFMLDVKKDVPYRLVSDLIIKTNALAYSVFITYNAEQARALYQINSEVMISASIKSEQELRKLVDYNIPDNKLIAFVGTKIPSKNLSNTLRSHGILSILGTMGNLDKQATARGYQLYAEHIENGVDIISTDNPLEAQQALNYYIRKRNITSSFIEN